MSTPAPALPPLPRPSPAGPSPHPTPWSVGTVATKQLVFDAAGVAIAMCESAAVAQRIVEAVNGLDAYPSPLTTQGAVRPHRSV